MVFAWTSSVADDKKVPDRITSCSFGEVKLDCRSSLNLVV
jgi:hypothetical protein